MTLFRLLSNLLTKVARSNSMVATAIMVVFCAISITLMASTTSGTGNPLLPTPSHVDTTAYHNYPYIRFINEGDSAKITDEEFFDIAGKIIFPINKYNLPKRDSLVLQLENEVFPLINRDSLELAYMILRGATSPEGPLRWNNFLGEKRAETILNFIKENLAMPLGDKFNIELDIEDYRTLCLMMRRAGDKDYGYVQAMCDQYLPKKQTARLKAILASARQGTMWLRLFREYFPRLRAARMVLFFYAPHKFKQPEIRDITPLPQEPQDVQEPQEPQDVQEPQESQIVLEQPITKLPRREVLSVKTNMLLYGFYLPGGYNRWCPIPNVALEYYPKHGHFTYGASIDFPWWRSYYEYKFFQVRNYQLEARYYFRSGDIRKRIPGQGAAFRGWYLQGYFGAGLFNICFDKDSGYEGEYLGGGIGAGYVLPLTKKGHWRLEFQLQAGVVYGKYDPYQWENLINPAVHDKIYYYRWTGAAEDFKLRQYRFSWIGPTRVGVTLTYDLLYDRIKKKGVSFRSYEKVDGNEDGNENENENEYENE